MTAEEKSKGSQLPISLDVLAAFLVNLEKSGLIHINRKKLKLT
jgi:hypothetical protein